MLSTMNTYTVTEAAKRLNRSVNTLQRWDRQGTLKAHRTKTNRRYYTEKQLREFVGLEVPAERRRIVSYCRVSSQAQRTDLKNQRNVVEDFCIAKGFSGVEYVTEVGGGLNFKRKKFLVVIDDILAGEISHLVIVHKDRFLRFGFELVEHLCEKNGCEIIVLNSEKFSPEEEMVQDLMAIVHTFSSRLYGLRNYRKSLREALKKE